MSGYVLEATTRIAAEPQRVWQALADTSRMPQWMANVTDVEGDALGQGARLVVTTQVGSHVLVSHVRVDSFEPGRRVAWIHEENFLDAKPFTMMADGRTEFTVTPKGEATEVYARVSFTPKGFKAKVAASLFVDSKVRPQLVQSLERLKALVD